MIKLGISEVKLDSLFRVVKITYTDVPVVTQTVEDQLMNPANISAMPVYVEDVPSIYDNPDLWPGGKKPELKKPKAE